MAGRSIGATLVLKIGEFYANVKKAEAGVENLKKKFKLGNTENKKYKSGIDNTSSSLKSMAKSAAGAIGAYVGFREAKDFLVDCCGGVMELERANERLESLMMVTKGTTKGMVQEVIGYADELERVTTIEGDATVAGVSQLASFQLQSENLKKLMPGLQNLAVSQYGVNVTQENMIQSANMLGKVMAGQTGALSRAGVVFNEQQKKILQTGTESERTAALVEILDQNFGNLAEKMAQTDEGKIVSLKNAWGSVKDEIGFALMPAVSDAVGYIHEHIPQIRDTVESACDKISKGIKWVTDNSNWLVPVLAGVATAIVGVSVAMGIMNLVMTASPVTWIVLGIVAAIAALVAIGVVLYKNWDTIKESLSAIWQSIKNGAVAMWEGIKNAFKTGIEKIKEFWNNLKEFLKNPIKGVVNLFKKTDEDDPGDGDGEQVDGSHRGGLARVPFDGYIARLHKNERVLTAEENRQYISGGSKTMYNVFKFYITTNELSDEAVDKFASKVQFALANM